MKVICLMFSLDAESDKRHLVGTKLIVGKMLIWFWGEDVYMNGSFSSRKNSLS